MIDIICEDLYMYLDRMDVLVFFIEWFEYIFDKFIVLFKELRKLFDFLLMGI